MLSGRGAELPDLRFRRYDAHSARDVREIVALIYRDAYAERIASGDSFGTPEAFMRRFDDHIKNPAFDLVISYAGNEPVGQSWGFAARPTIVEVPDAVAGESQPVCVQPDAEHIFALCEIMVRTAWAGQGIAHALHDELLRARTESCAELYVRPDNTRAYRAYLKWGWRRAGETRPNLPDAPLFDVLILPLPIDR